jgi:outer membrane lipoprotein-sorting protein
MIATAGVLLALLAQAEQDDAAKEALKKLADRMRDAKTLSAKVSQQRRTELLDKPVTSSGTMLYRREPGRMVFRMTEPRTTEIHLDRTCYQVYRPDEQRLERFEFEDDSVTGKLLAVFDAKPEQMGKSFGARSGARRGDDLEVLLSPTDERVKGRMRKLSLTISTADGTLKRIDYEDADGDEVRFEMSDLTLNPDLAPEVFELKVPEGTRVLRHKAKFPR